MKIFCWEIIVYKVTVTSVFWLSKLCPTLVTDITVTSVITAITVITVIISFNVNIVITIKMRAAVTVPYMTWLGITIVITIIYVITIVAVITILPFYTIKTVITAQLHFCWEKICPIFPDFS